MGVTVISLEDNRTSLAGKANHFIGVLRVRCGLQK